MLALVGAPAAWTERVLAFLAPSEAGAVRERLSRLGPIRLSDVEEARRRIAELAQRLAMQGRIELPREGTGANKR